MYIYITSLFSNGFMTSIPMFVVSISLFLPNSPVWTNYLNVNFDDSNPNMMTSPSWMGSSTALFPIPFLSGPMPPKSHWARFWGHKRLKDVEHLNDIQNERPRNQKTAAFCAQKKWWFRNPMIWFPDYTPSKKSRGFGICAKKWHVHQFFR